MTSESSIRKLEEDISDILEREDSLASNLRNEMENLEYMVRMLGRILGFEYNEQVGQWITIQGI